MNNVYISTNMEFFSPDKGQANEIKKKNALLCYLELSITENKFIIKPFYENALSDAGNGTNF